MRIPHVPDTINGVDQLIPLDDWTLVKKREIRHAGPIDTVAAHLICMKLDYLNDKDSEEPIRLIFEDCPGGSVSAGMAIYDAMQTVDCPVITVCMGMCASMGAVLFAAGSKGKRYIMEHAEIMCHQPSAGTQGMVSNMDIDINHFRAVRVRLNKILAKHTGQSEKRIQRETEKDRWFTAEEAVAYGLADEIIYEKRKE
ncbi:MAG: ATP-dependent Clp protease proteolytic subunit [Oscillospiraceae bacterium]|nr:ATP-dependent Clp protease proteolytic subunit [Oscillospiraceae bacterium]